jgi:hypothetical protein
MQDLSSKHIIPNMEQKIRVLNQQVIFVSLNLLSETQHLIHILCVCVFVLISFCLVSLMLRLGFCNT